MGLAGGVVPRQLVVGPVGFWIGRPFGVGISRSRLFCNGLAGRICGAVGLFVVGTPVFTIPVRVVCSGVFVRPVLGLVIGRSIIFLPVSTPVRVARICSRANGSGLRGGRAFVIF